MASRDINEPQHAFRFLDVDEEPLKILPPILDYESTPLVSIDKAIVPLGSIVPSIVELLVSKILAKILGTQKWTDLDKILGTDIQDL